WLKVVWCSIVLLICAAAMDLALSRVHYHYLFRYEIGPAKAEALQAMKNVNATVKAKNLSCTVFDPFTNQTV
ncbi:hypothetical protein FOZ63_011684, partial [Perkinsus olseni]